MNATRTAELAHLATTRPPPAWQIERAIQLARNTARRYSVWHTASGIDEEDLLAEAYAEAWGHVLTWDPEMSAFDSWVINGCRTAVLGALRRANALSRSEWHRWREEQKADPLAAAPRLLLSLEACLSEDDRDHINRVDVRDIEILSPLDPAIAGLPARLDAEHMATVALAALNPRLLKVAQLWMAGRTLKAIAAQLAVSESRSHQLWDEARRAMRVALHAGGLTP